MPAFDALFGSLDAAKYVASFGDFVSRSNFSSTFDFLTSNHDVHRAREMSLLERSPDELRDPLRVMVESTAPSPINTPLLRPPFPRYATAEPSMLSRSPPDDLAGALQLLAPGLTSHDLDFSPLNPIMPPIRPPFSRSASTNDLMGELRHAQREIEMLKTMVCGVLPLDNYASV